MMRNAVFEAICLPNVVDAPATITILGRKHVKARNAIPFACCYGNIRQTYNSCGPMKIAK